MELLVNWDSCSGNSPLFPFFLPALEFKELYQSYFQANYTTLVLLDDFNVFLKMKICQPAWSWIQIPPLMIVSTSISSFILWSNSSSRNVHYPPFFVKLLLLFVFFWTLKRRSIYLFIIFNLSLQSLSNVRLSSLTGHTTSWRIWQWNIVSQPEILAPDGIFNIHYKIEWWLRSVAFQIFSSFFVSSYISTA